MELKYFNYYYKIIERVQCFQQQIYSNCNKVCGNQSNIKKINQKTLVEAKCNKYSLFIVCAFSCNKAKTKYINKCRLSGAQWLASERGRKVMGVAFSKLQRML